MMFAVTSFSVTSQCTCFLWPFHNQEIILPMNFDGGRVKTEVKKICDVSLQVSFNYRLCRANVIQRR